MYQEEGDGIGADALVFGKKRYSFLLAAGVISTCGDPQRSGKRAIDESKLQHASS